ncbi:MAG: conjugal transfer protein TraX [Clostridiales Family XIII bacterium]|jgi:hypothetical protein|nr:conjugal transfer protein TraX [Clostridiales Family XIII bacterium]
MKNTTALNAQTKKTFGLSGTGIKLLALGLMLLDHIHYFFEFTGVIPLWFSMAGRLSGWLFLFITVEGFAHTSNRKKYFLRIWLLAVGMGAVNYAISIFLQRGDGFHPENNIFATLALLLVLWQGIDWLRQKQFVKGLVALAIPFALWFGFARLPISIMPWAYLLEQTLMPLPMMTEGGLPYLIGGIMLFLFRKRRKLQVAVWAVVLLTWNLYIGIASGLPFGMQWITYHFEWMGVFAALPMLLYNGQRGRGLKQFFYAFYPLHVYVLWGLSFAVYTLMI